MTLRPTSTRALVVVAVVGVVGLALSMAPWWVRRLADPEAFGGLALSAVAVVVAAFALRGDQRPAARARFSIVAGVIGVVVGSVVGVHLVMAAGVACLAHAVAAVVAPRRTSALLPALWLFVLALPLAGDLDVIGFPARLFAARVAAAALSLVGVDVAGAETVLVVEGNVADVEAPCAGLSTLRMLAAVVIVTGALRRSRARSIVAAVVVAGVVAVVGNAARVTALAGLALAAHHDDLARLVHVPLGVVAFVVAIAAGDLVLRYDGADEDEDAGADVDVGLTGVAVIVAVTAAVAALATPPTKPPTKTLSASPNATPLTPAEQALFGRHAVFAEKRSLPTGSVLVVVASSLRAHHAPERCLAGSGLRVDATSTTTVAGVPVKRLVLDGGVRLGLSFYVRDDGGTPVVMASLVERAADQLQHPHALWAFASIVVAADTDADTLLPPLVDDAHQRLLQLTPSEPR